MTESVIRKIISVIQAVFTAIMLLRMYLPFEMLAETVVTEENSTPILFAAYFLLSAFLVAAIIAVFWRTLSVLFYEKNHFRMSLVTAIVLDCLLIVTSVLSGIFIFNLEYHAVLFYQGFIVMACVLVDLIFNIRDIRADSRVDIQSDMQLDDQVDIQSDSRSSENGGSDTGSHSKSLKWAILYPVITTAVTGMILALAILISTKISLDVQTEVMNAAMAGNFNSFTMNDVYGNEYNEDLLKGHNVTMVNIWETNCNPCIEEMPFLQEIVDEKDFDDFQIVGLLGDGIVNGQASDANVEAARKIMETLGVKYTVLVPSPEIYEGVIKGKIQTYPTTIFLDENGNMIKFMSGGVSKDEWMKIINSVLLGGAADKK